MRSLSCEVNMFFQRQKLKIAAVIFIVCLVVLITEVLMTQKMCSHFELLAFSTAKTLEKELTAPPNVETPNGSKTNTPPGAPAQEPSEEDIVMFQFPVVASLAADAINITISSEKLVAELVSSDKKLGCEEAVNWPESSSDIYFSMKSIAAYHVPRLSLLLVTWLQTVDPLQVTFGQSHEIIV